jgi:TIR domain
MPRVFISHSSRNNDWAIALRDWLVAEGWSGPDDIFLDLDPEQGIAAGQKWQHAFADAATRCEAVLFIVSAEWLASRWCQDEYQLANKYNKKLFALLIDDYPLERLPGGLTAQWQIVQLRANQPNASLRCIRTRNSNGLFIWPRRVSRNLRAGCIGPA